MSNRKILLQMFLQKKNYCCQIENNLGMKITLDSINFILCINLTRFVLLNPSYPSSSHWLSPTMSFYRRYFSYVILYFEISLYLTIKLLSYNINFIIIFFFCNRFNSIFTIFSLIYFFTWLDLGLVDLIYF